TTGAARFAASAGVEIWDATALSKLASQPVDDEFVPQAIENELRTLEDRDRALRARLIDLTAVSERLPDQMRDALIWVSHRDGRELCDSVVSGPLGQRLRERLFEIRTILTSLDAGEVGNQAPPPQV
ncbi:MAG TPA: hypothetical protein PLS95_09745, partial [Thermoanaerobaculales bacterium]|nr:hypothetical protein [Thermoanaerobaculales bacterium]